MREYTPAATFDWYAATVDESPVDLIEALCAYLGLVERRARGLHGYSAGADLLRGTDVVAKVIYGGEQSPHVWASGVDAHDLALALRALWPTGHYVTRVDVALDFVEGDCWDDLYAATVTVADRLPSGVRRTRPLKLATVGDWIRAADGYPGGRTLYVGSLKSPVFARLYEKGKQMRQLYPDQLDKYDAGWVRLELQVRPQGDSRAALAKLDAAAIWGASRWSTDLYTSVCGATPTTVPVQHSRPGDDDRAWRYLLRQYGPLLRRRIADTPPGDAAARLELWAELGGDLGRALG